MARGEQHAWRLDIAAAVAQLGGPLSFEELGGGPGGERGTITVKPDLFGDFVLARKDAPASYHLAVVVDDGLQGVTLVTRGNDLFAAAHVHRLLQALLKLPVPQYSHHRLILDAGGKRLAKRDQATTLKHLRADGWTPARVREAVELTSR
jgi:glutamyl-Q tRNA(Asp) synthetase